MKASLSTSTLVAPPGGTAGCDLSVVNPGSEPVTAEVELAGPAAPWAVVLPGAMVVAGGGSARARVTVEVPRDAGLAGTARDLLVAVAGARLVASVAVAEVRELRATVTPLVARARGAATYTVTVVNTGTGWERADLAAVADLTARVTPAQVDVGPGEQVTAEVTVEPPPRLFSGRGRSHRLVVEVRPADGPPLTAAATHFQDPVRWRPAAAVAGLGAALVVAVAVAGGGHQPPAPVPAGPRPSTIAASTPTCVPAGDPSRVAIAGFAFCPAVLTVAPGTEVVWSNADLSPHTVTFTGADDPFDSGPLDEGQAWSHRFDRPGVYRYDCRLHPGMSGTVVVA